MKVVTDVVEGGGSVYVDPDAPAIVTPVDFAPPPGGLHIRGFDMGIPQEDRLYHHKLYAALAYARANRLNRITVDPPRRGWASCRRARPAGHDAGDGRPGPGRGPCRGTGHPDAQGRMTWPLDPQIVRTFARGLATIVVVEEKRPVLEDQLRAILYGTPAAPVIVGKFAGSYVFDAQRAPMMLPNAGETNPAMVAKVLATVLSQALPGCGLAAPIAAAGAAGTPAPGAGSAPVAPAPMRLPGFCSGCPHNARPRCRGQPRAGRHRLPRHGAAHQSRADDHDLAHGAEGVMWAGPAALHRREARVREPGRRHVHALQASSRCVRRSPRTCRSPTRSCSTASCR